MPTGDVARDTWIRAAALRMIYAANTVWQICCDEQSSDGRMAIEGNTFHGKNYKGFGESIRKYGLHDLCRLCSDNVTTELIRQVGEEMEGGRNTHIWPSPRIIISG